MDTKVCSASRMGRALESSSFLSAKQILEKIESFFFFLNKNYIIYAMRICNGSLSCAEKRIKI